jgi:transcriptional regulator with XRE-family HTH domain
MANDRLRSALLQHGLTPEKLAEGIGVDAKTVERWIGGRVPHRRHRYAVSTQLRFDETYLWPDAIARDQAADASESEIVAVYPHRWAAPKELWGNLFEAAEREVGILVYSGFFIADDPGQLALIKAKAADGVRVRILLGDPDSSQVAARGADEGIDESMAGKIRNVIVLYKPLRDIDGIEIRLHDTVLYNSIYRSDDQLLVNPHVYGAGASLAPVMHLRHVAGGGMVHTYLESFEKVWSRARPLD